MINFDSAQAWAVLAGLLLVPGCQQPSVEALSEDEIAVIRQLTADWLLAHSARDWDSLARHYSSDAVLMPPMAPPIAGRSAIREWFRANENDTRVEVTILEIDGHGDLAYVRGESRVTLGLSTDVPVTFVGKYLDIRRRQADGSWLVSVDMFSPDVALN